MNVIIRGDGVAAYCCAHLLAKAGFHVSLESADRPRLPAILLGDQALALIRDVFGQPALLADLPRIRKRVVAWGTGATPLTVEHSAIVVSEETLLEGIRPSEIEKTNPSQEPRWTIFAARPLPSPAIEHRFGSRLATAVPVTLKESSDVSACRIESVEDGWLFLIPNQQPSAWLLSVGEKPQALLDRSRVIAAEIAELGQTSGPFASYPRIAAPLCGPDWLACGTAAMAFDPICGDGTAHAIREAILASAVIRALAAGGSPDDLKAHYEARLTAGFHLHLTLARRFYLTGGISSFWTKELNSIDQGIEWCAAQLAPHASFRYQLRGFELEAVR
jgi:hypothetical protein